MIVLGLGFGDEGKGLTTSFLCSRVKYPIVVRFNGGHQAGHTVVYDGIRHVFSSFGSGTLQGVPTLLSHHCTFFPTAVVNEYEVLRNKGIHAPKLYVHPLCPVTTPYDLSYNQMIEDARGDARHGSVGVGFGTTIERHEKEFFKLHVQDLKYPGVVKAKLNNIQRYYGMTLDNKVIEDYLDDIKYLMTVIDIIDYEDIHKIYRGCANFIFEGAQGVLLDQDFGFFPNVTRSNTTSKNAIELAKILYRYEHYHPDIYYVTRSYQTRHGAGFMSDEQDLPLKNNEKETNISHDYQGDLRIGKIDVDMIKYAIECDDNFSKQCRKHLVVTCMDQYTIDIEKQLLCHLKDLPDELYTSWGPSLTNIKRTYF